MVEGNAKESQEKEIQELEQKLAEKKQELLKMDKAHEEKDVFRQVLREHIEEMRTSMGGTAQTQISSKPQPAQPIPQPLSDEEIKKREEKIRELIELALTKTIRDAVKNAENTSPYLLDELHDRLVDDYYDKLVALRKVKTL